MYAIRSYYESVALQRIHGSIQSLLEEFTGFGVIERQQGTIQLQQLLANPQVGNAQRRLGAGDLV